MFLRGVHMRERKWPGRSRTQEQYRISNIYCENISCFIKACQISFVIPVKGQNEGKREIWECYFAFSLMCQGKHSVVY